MNVLPGIIYGISVLFAVFSSAGQISSAQYNQDLIKFCDKELTAHEQIANEKMLISKLKGQITKVDSQISCTGHEQYSFLNRTSSDLERAEQETSSFQQCLHELKMILHKICSIARIK